MALLFLRWQVFLGLPGNIHQEGVHLFEKLATFLFFLLFLCFSQGGFSRFQPKIRVREGLRRILGQFQRRHYRVATSPQDPMYKVVYFFAVGEFEVA